MSQNITLAEAVEMTSRYRAQRESILIPVMQGRGILPVCETIDRAQVDSLLAQPGCTKIRIYYGMYADQTVHAVLVGVDATDADILPPTSLSATNTDPVDGDIINQGYRCPPICPPESELNT